MAICSRNKDIVIAVDLGASRLRVALFDKNCNLLSKVEVRTPRGGDELTIPNAIVSLIKSVTSAEQLRGAIGVGVGSIGPLDVKQGAVVNPPGVPFKRIPIVSTLSEALNLPVCLLNDCAAAAWGEKHYGAGKEVDNFVYLTFSTGIGCGAVVDGRLLFGKDGNAHEVGHFVIDVEGRLVCGCGRRGHWEAYCSGTGIPKLAKLIASKVGEEVLMKSKVFPLLKSGRLDAKSIIDAAREGDELASIVLEEVAKLNAIGIANVINAYDPSLVTVGGSVALVAFDLIVEKAIPYLGEFAVNALPKVVKTPLGDDAVLIGAAAAVLNPPR